MHALATLQLLIAVLPPKVPVLLITFAVSAIVGFSMESLTVADERDSLAVRFGLLPLFGTKVRYADVTSVSVGKLGLLDGWGMNYAPGRGWVFSIRGRDCVDVFRGRRLLRIGTAEPEQLAALIREKTESSRVSA